MAEAGREKKSFAMMFMDIDLFKEINDQWGHDAGDAVLVAVADRIRRAVRASDIVCRLGGDEFVLLLADAGNRDFAAMVANKLIDGIVQPVTILPSGAGGAEQVSVGVSIGISLFPEDDTVLENLLNKADHAMYEAKKEVPPCYRFYGDEQ